MPFKKEKERTHIINYQIVNHQAPKLQRTPKGWRQAMFGQPTKKSRKNASNLLLNFRTNPKVLVQPNLKNSQHHYHVAKKIFTTNK